MKNRETKRAAREHRKEIAAGKPALQPPPMPGPLHRPQEKFKLGNGPREFSSIAKKQISGILGRAIRAKEERERLEKAVGILNNDENNSPRSGRPELNSSAAAAAAAAPVAAAAQVKAAPVRLKPIPKPSDLVIRLGPVKGAAGGAGGAAAGRIIPELKVGYPVSSPFITAPPAPKSTRRRKTQRRRR